MRRVEAGMEFNPSPYHQNKKKLRLQLVINRGTILL